MLTDSDVSDHLDPQGSLPGEQRRAKASKEDDREGGNLKEECKRESKEEWETHTVKKDKPKRKKERDGERRKDADKHEITVDSEIQTVKKDKHKSDGKKEEHRDRNMGKRKREEDSDMYAVRKKKDKHTRGDQERGGEEDNNSTGMTDRDKHPLEGKKAKDEDRRTDKCKHEGKQDDEIYTARKKKRKHERLEEDKDVYREKHKHKKKEDRDRSKKRQHKHKKERREMGDRDRCKEKDKHVHESKEDRDKTKHGKVDKVKHKHKERKRDDKAKPLDGKVRKEKGDVFASPPRVKYEPDNEPCHLAKRARKRKQDDWDNAVKPLKAKKLEQEDFVVKKATREIKVEDFDGKKKVTNGTVLEGDSRGSPVGSLRAVRGGPLPIKWTFLEHKGPVFTPEYEPLPDNVMLHYDGEHMKLSPAAEEVATFYARMLHHDCARKDIFKENFFKDWQKEMTAEERDKIKDLAKCHFRGMRNHFKAQSKARRVMSREEKQKVKEENKRLLLEYGFCTIDKQKERIYNFRTELPGLFRGLGAHPKMGMLKHRIKPEDCIINCSEDSKRPKPPPGKRWKAVCHNNKATWLVSWVDNINGLIKYISPSPGSRVKGKKDCPIPRVKGEKDCPSSRVKGEKDCPSPSSRVKGEKDCQPIIKDDDTRKKKRRHKHDGKDTSTKQRHKKHKSKGKERHKKEKHRQHKSKYKHKKDESKRRDRERRHRSSHAHSSSQAGGITLHSTVAV